LRHITSTKMSPLMQRLRSHRNRENGRHHGRRSKRSCGAFGNAGRKLYMSRQNIERLSGCDESAISEIDRRIAKLEATNAS
jgi:hypothetical protein